MASGVGGADWFEVAGRLAQTETNIGLGRILDASRPGRIAHGQDGQEKKGQNKQLPSYASENDKKGRVVSSANTDGKGTVFGPPSPPLKRHAAPLFKAAKVADVQSTRKPKLGQNVLELEDVTQEKHSTASPEHQEEQVFVKKDGAGSMEGNNGSGHKNEARGSGATQEDTEKSSEERVTSRSVQTDLGPFELCDIVGTSSADQEPSLLRDWSQPSLGKRANHLPRAKAQPLKDPIAATQSPNLVDDQAGAKETETSKEEEGQSIWQFNESGKQDHAQERRGSLQMEELAGPATSDPGEGTPEGARTTPRRDDQIVLSSPFGALSSVPGWNLAQTSLLSTSIGQRMASFVGDVVAASAEHEQRFSGRLRSNSFKKNGASSAELDTMDGVTGSGTDSRADAPAVLASSGGEERSLPEAVVSVEKAEADAGDGGGAAEVSNADWMSRIQSATTSQLGEWLARIKTTYRGSKEDIGWLQREPGMPPVTDGTERFLQLLAQIVHGIHSLSDEFVYLLLPGLFSNFGPLYLCDTKKYLAKLGLSAHIAKIHSELALFGRTSCAVGLLLFRQLVQAAVEKNALEICQYIEELNWGTGKQVVILGHSKGGIDACAALALFPDRLAGKVRGVALVQSPYAGNPVCSDILREGQVADFGSRAVLQALMQHALKGELRALEDLTYEHRRAFILSHPLPPGIPLVSFHTEASRAPTALSTITTVGHAELPLAALVAGATSSAAAQAAGVGKLPIGVPIGATLATVAGHLELRYGEKSDGLVTRRDAEVPGSVVVRPEKKLDHAWPVFGGGKAAPGDPEPAHVNEALLTLLIESQFPPGQAPVVRQVRSGDPPKRWR